MTTLRTLRQEILYMREEGFHRNTVEQATLLSWLGEQAMLEVERDDAVNRSVVLDDKVRRLGNLVVRCKRAIDSGAPDSTLVADLQAAFNDA